MTDERNRHRNAGYIQEDCPVPAFQHTGHPEFNLDPAYIQTRGKAEHRAAQSIKQLPALSLN